MTIFDQSQKGQHAFSLPKKLLNFSTIFHRQTFCVSMPLFLPEVSELGLTRHFVSLSQKKYGDRYEFLSARQLYYEIQPPRE